MKRSERLQTLHGLAAHEEEQQSRRFGAAQERLSGARHRLEELIAYRNDYQSYSGTPGSGGTTAPAVNWQEHHNFLKRLDEAVSLQHEAVAHERELVETERQAWMLKRQRLESLNRVMERYAGIERADDARREQRLQDATPVQDSPFARKGSLPD